MSNLDDILKTQIGGSHYKNQGIEPAKLWLKNDLRGCEAAAIKYIMRWRNKGGIKDLEKAIHFLHMLIAHEYDQTGTKYEPINYGKILKMDFTPVTSSWYTPTIASSDGERASNVHKEAQQPETTKKYLTFDDLKFEKNEAAQAHQACLKFNNGYGVSIIWFDYADRAPYNDAKYELGVLDNHGVLTFLTPIADDVICRLTSRRVTEIMKQIQDLPPIHRVKETNRSPLNELINLNFIHKANIIEANRMFLNFERVLEITFKDISHAQFKIDEKLLFDYLIFMVQHDSCFREWLFLFKYIKCEPEFGASPYYDVKGFLLNYPTI